MTLANTSDADAVYFQVGTLVMAGLLKAYQQRFPGAMYSGCGGGYLYIVSEKPVPGAFRVTVRVAE